MTKLEPEQFGRMFYDVNERDTWQVIPFLKGVAGTGKSFIINILLSIFDPKDVGILSNNVEEQFGLAPLQASCYLSHQRSRRILQSIRQHSRV